MRLVIWHGYLLGGTGSNVYTRSLAREWSHAGHDVTVVCQDPRPDRFDLGGAGVVRPQLDGPLPVFVLDRYEGAEARLLTEMTAAERRHFVDVNAAAVRALYAQGGAVDLLLANHVLLGAPVGEASGVPYVVKAHGSELEFAMRDDAELCGWARQTLAGAEAVVAGSAHIAGVLEDLVGIDRSRVQVIPPGVDVQALRPEDRRSALDGLLAECAADPRCLSQGDDERSPDLGNAERLQAFFSDDRKTVVYVGKLSQEKGVSLLLDALQGIDARCVIVGFGPERRALEAAAGPDVIFTGPLEHRHLAHLWPLADVSVTPSVFPEAFGMVAAEAAACGSPPLVARHSGLAEVAAGVEAGYPPHLRHLASFRTGDRDDLSATLDELLALPAHEWHELSLASRQTAVDRWSWSEVARRILDTAR